MFTVFKKKVKARITIICYTTSFQWANWRKLYNQNCWELVWNNRLYKVNLNLLKNFFIYLFKNEQRLFCTFAYFFEKQNLQFIDLEVNMHFIALLSQIFIYFSSGQNYFISDFLCSIFYFFEDRKLVNFCQNLKCSRLNTKKLCR